MLTVILLKIISFYLMLVGVWRMHTAIIQVSHSTALTSIDYEEKHYEPLSDPANFKEILKWMVKTLKDFHLDDFNDDSVIMHRQLKWGIFWLVLGLIIFSLA